MSEKDKTDIVKLENSDFQKENEFSSITDEKNETTVIDKDDKLEQSEQISATQLTADDEDKKLSDSSREMIEGFDYMSYVNLAPPYIENRQPQISNHFVGCANSTRGKAHMENGLPCQDSSEVFVSDDFCIVAISDGHSDPHCLRSHIGSNIAIKVAINVIKNFLEDGKYIDFLNDVRNGFTELFKDMLRQILNDWRVEVSFFDGNNPITDQEWTFLETRMNKTKTSVDITRLSTEIKTWGLYKIYGATLKIGVLFKDCCFMLSIGDGEIVALSSDGSYMAPIPDDEDTEGSESHSLCDEDAINYCKYAFIDEPTIGVLSCSDGIEISPERDDNKYYIGEYLKEIMSYSNPEDSGWVQRFEKDIYTMSQNFPKDDCSISFAYNREFDKDALKTAKEPLHWNNSLIVEKATHTSIFKKNIDGYSFIINQFDETCYRGLIGQKMMKDILNDFCSKTPEKLKSNDQNVNNKTFELAFKHMLQNWNDMTIKYDKANPDSDEERRIRLTNGIDVSFRPQKYGLSLAICLFVKGTTYIALVGKGTLTVQDEDSETILQYSNPCSSAHIGFSDILFLSGKKTTAITIKGIDEKDELFNLM